MGHPEDIEQVRQAIMRFHELLSVMRERLEDGDRAYARLFSSAPAETIAHLKEKDQQWALAEHMVQDASLSELGRAVGKLRFDARMLERSFEELGDIIATAQLQE